jgi:F-type H+-transporting ATPase subunit epsilon
MTIHVDVVSAEQSIFSGVAEVVVAPAQMGEVGIYPRHAPMITHLKPGALEIKVPDKDEKELVFLSGGILEVQPGVVTVLADHALRGHDLDEAKALEAKKLAEEAMSNKTAAVEYATAQKELAMAAAQLRAIQKLRSRKH